MKIKKALQAAFLGLVLTVGGQQAEAMAVVDAPHIAQSILNTAEQIARWSSYMSQFRSYYATINAVYYGVKNWKDMGWVDALKLVELPWFDNMEGIADLRNIAAGIDMGIYELNLIFADLQWFDRMMNDPKFRDYQGYMAEMKIMRRLAQRQMRRKMMITRAYHSLQRENAELLKQMKTIQTEIENSSKLDPVPLGAIQALQSRIMGIQAKMQNNRDGIYAQIQAIEQQEQAEFSQAQDQLSLDLLQMRRNSMYFHNYWEGFLYK